MLKSLYVLHLLDLLENIVFYYWNSLISFLIIYLRPLPKALLRRIPSCQPLHFLSLYLYNIIDLKLPRRYQLSQLLLHPDVLLTLLNHMVVNLKIMKLWFLKSTLLTLRGSNLILILPKAFFFFFLIGFGFSIFSSSIFIFDGLDFFALFLGFLLFLLGFLSLGLALFPNFPFFSLLSLDFGFFIPPQFWIFLI